jgi:membrane-associated phospholipid phosphatase
LDKILPDGDILPKVAPRNSFWSAYHRRPVFLLILLAGLGLFLAKLPASTRATLWTAFFAQRFLVVLLVFFALLTISLIWAAGQRMDAKIFVLFNTRGYPIWLDRFMWLATQLGNFLAALMAAAIAYFLNDRHLAIVIVLGTLTLLVLVETIKSLADRERPYLTFEESRIIGVREKGDSFPSGHTSQTFFLAMLLVQHLHPSMAITIAIFSVGALVGFTRIYVGAHYPRDVLAGLVLGSVWGILATLLDPYWLVLGF